MKIKRLLFLLVCFFPVSLFAETEKMMVGFSEIWAYLMAGEEKYLEITHPISDIGYFSARINHHGKLIGVPDPKKIKFFKGRIHLVVAELGNHALTHFCLNPEYPLRNTLINEIAAATAPFDGVQIDFEAVYTADKDIFFGFLRDLKKKLGTKLFSIAVPARLSDIKNDRYDYAVLEKIVDRVIIMAYDEHWSTSKPGSIASINWCKNISTYSRSRIANDKLVMGLPFYGRAWADKNPSTAYKHSGITRLISEKDITELSRKEGIPYLQYQETVNVQVYYEDALSLFHRLNLYKNNAVNAVAFWRLGQEDPEVWNYLTLNK